MSIKVLVVLSLVAVAASSPTPTILPRIPLPGISIGGNVGGGVGLQIGSLDLGKGLKNLFGGLIGFKKTARNDLNNILNLKVSSFNDVCTLLSRVSISLWDTVEASITGLGNLLSRVTITLLKIIICVIGGAGKNNPICGTDVNVLVGVKASVAADARAVIDLFGVADCKARLNNIINIYTKGKGISVCRGSVRVILKLAQDLVNTLQVVIDGSRSLGKSDFQLCFHGITSLVGTIGNSRQKGLGLKIAKNFVNVCNKYVVGAGYPDFGGWDQVQVDIDAGNDDNAPWSISDVDASADVSISLGGLIGNLFKGLKGVTRLATNLVQDIAKIVINSVEDVFNLALKIVLGLGGLLDATIAGLGSLLVRIVAGLLKIVLCFVGTGKYGVCQPSWERQVGVSGSVTSIDVLIKLYGIGNCRHQVDQYINEHTNGGGLGSTSGSVKIMLQSVQKLADIVQAKKWNSDIVVIVFRHITYLLGAVGNSNARGVGTSVCNKFIPACNKYLTSAGYPGFGDNENDIIKVVEDANNDNTSWSADFDDSDDKTNGFIIGGSVGGSTGGNTGGSTGGNGGSTGGNTGGSTGGNTGGSTGGNTGGSTGGNTGGSTGGNGGSTGGNTGGSTGGNGGSTGGNTGGSTGGNTGGSTGGNNGVSVGGGTGLIGGLIKGVFGTIKGVSKLAFGALDTVLKITIGALNDVFSLIVNLSLVLQVTLNNLASGLGSLFVRLVACIIKIAVCVLGYPGDRGVCAKGWNAKFGISGEASTAADLILLFRVNEANKEFNNYVNIITKGKGISSSTGSVRTVLEKINVLITYTDNYKKITKQTVTDTFVILTTVSGCISNSRKTNSGQEIIQKIVPECGKYFKRQGYPDISIKVTTITKECSSSNGDSVNWDGNNNGNTDSDNGNTGSDNGNTGSNNGNTGSDNGNTGNNNGNTGSDNGNTGNNNGNTGNDHGNTGNNNGNSGNDNGNTNSDNENTGNNNGNNGSDNANTGSDNGNTGNNNGNTGSDSGNTGNNNGNTGNDSGNTGSDNGNTGNNNGNTGSDNGNTGSDNGNTGNNNGNNGSDNGNTGSDNGNTGSDNGNTGNNNNNTGSNSGNTDNNNGNTGSDNGNTGNNNGNTGNDNGNTGSDNGNTGNNNGNTGSDNGNTGSDNGNTGNNNGNTGSDNGNTGSDNGNSGSDNGNTGSDNGNNDNNNGNTGSNNGNGIDIGKTIGGIIKLIPGVASISSNIINEIIKIKINTLVDIINFVTKLTIALGGIIDSIISGLGSILIRIVAVIFKIGYCVNGYGNDKSICTKEWNAQFGITGDASTYDDLISLFRLSNCKSDVANIVSTYTKGKGISSTSGFINIVLQKVTDLSVTVSSGSITKEVFATVFVNVVNIFGSVTNSYKQGSASAIVQTIIPACATIFVKQGFPDIRNQLDTVKSTINVGNNDKFNWSIVKNGGDSNSDKLVTKVKQVFKDVKSKNNVPSVTAVLNLQPPQNFDDVLAFGIQVVQAVGGVLDLFITGLGSLIARVVGGLINYIVAILGAARNAKSFVSQKAFYDGFGVTVSGKTWASLSAGFKIDNAKGELDGILKAYTNNKGLKSLSGAKLVFFNSAYSLVEIVAKGTGIVEADLTAVFRLVTTIIGGFANSCSANLGKTICDNMLPTVSYYLEKNGYPSLGSQSNAIYSTIETCNNADAPWASGTTTTIVN